MANVFFVCFFCALPLFLALFLFFPSFFLSLWFSSVSLLCLSPCACVRILWGLCNSMSSSVVCLFCYSLCDHEKSSKHCRYRKLTGIDLRLHPFLFIFCDFNVTRNWSEWRTQKCWDKNTEENGSLGRNCEMSRIDGWQKTQRPPRLDRSYLKRLTQLLILLCSV